MHLIDGLGFRDGWVASAQVEDLMVPSIMLFLVRLVDQDKRFQCLHCMVGVPLVLAFTNNTCCVYGRGDYFEGGNHTRNRSDRSPFLDHLSQSWRACFQLPLATAS